MKFFLWFFRRQREEREQDLQRELRSHLEAEAEELHQAGASAEDAHYAAQQTFGNFLLASEATRDAWGWAMLDRLAQDVRFAVRSLRKNLGYTALAVIVLALGIGANTAIFTAVNAALLRPLPFPEPERLVKVLHVAPKNVSGGGLFGVATGNFVEWRAQQDVFDGIALYHFHGLNLTGGDRPDYLQGVEVSDDFFHVMSVQPLLGRTFTPVEMQPGDDREVVLSYRAWQNYFGGDRGIVGHTYSFDRQNYTIIGVMPEGFRFPWGDVWVPAAWTAKDRANRNNHNSMAVARLKPGVTLERAQSKMDAISRRLESAYPTEDKGWGAAVLPLHEQMVSDVRAPLLILLGAVGLVLLIACSNVANLVLGKTLGRRKELAIRGALGARRSRVLQLVLVETVLLALGGCGLGLVLAHYGTAFIMTFLRNRLPSTIGVGLDGRVVLFALGISIVAGILAGLLPALRFTRQDDRLHDALKEGGRTDADTGRVGVRSALVVCEVALCMVLLISAGLLIRTLWVLHSTNPGFDPQHVMTMVIPRPGKPSPQNLAFLQQALERVRAIPGVESAAATSNVPLSHNDESTWSVQIEGRPPLPIAQQPNVATNVISPGYLATLRIPVLRGRDFTDADIADHPRVIIITQAMAQQFWPNEDPLGKRLFVSWTEPEKPREVVGIVGNTKDRGLEGNRPLAQMYVPQAQAPFPVDSLVIRSALPSSEIVAAATRAIHELDRQQPVLEIEPMEEVIADSYADRRSNMLLLAAFAALALVLAAAGIYGVLSYNMRRRLREIGIRLALGAKIGDVLRLVVFEGMRPTLIGVAIGIAGALALGRVFSTLIYGVRPTDLRTYAAVAVLLSATSLLATVIPAYRATRVQPLNVLRDE